LRAWTAKPARKNFFLKARLHAAAPPHTPAGPVITSVQLLDLGQQLMDESRSNPKPTIRMADAVQTG
jgi:hypothetical protein